MPDKNRVAPLNPFRDITITKSPLYREPEDLPGDPLGERALNNSVNERIENFGQSTANRGLITQADIERDRDRLLRGYYRRTPGGGRVHLGQFGTEPAPEEER